MAFVNYYLEENQKVLKKKENLFKILLIVFASLLVLLFILLTIFSTYETRTSFKIYGSIAVAIFALITVYMIFRYKEFHSYLFHFEQINQSPIVEKEVVFTNVKSKITLSDSTRVYEIYVKEEEKNRIYYLLSLFEPNFMENQKYTFRLAGQFIKEVNNED